MNKQNKIIVSILAMILGFVLNAIAWSIAIGPTFNTFALLIGLGLMFGGFISFIINIKN